MASTHPLDNPAWHALAGPHAAYAEVAGAARCYHPDVSVFAGVATRDAEGWAGLATLVRRHGPVTLNGPEPVVAPEGWVVLRQGVGHQLVGEELVATPPTRVEVVALGSADMGRMAALVALAQPGPWRARTAELGGYLGVVDGDRLVAMAGRRMQPAGYVEVSAVCTDPEAWGRGYGAAVTHGVARAALDAGLVPFLHVAEQNHRARALYERLGFRLRTPVSFSTLDLAPVGRCGPAGGDGDGGGAEDG